MGYWQVVSKSGENVENLVFHFNTPKQYVHIKVAINVSNYAYNVTLKFA